MNLTERETKPATGAKRGKTWPVPSAGKDGGRCQAQENMASAKRGKTRVS